MTYKVKLFQVNAFDDDILSKHIPPVNIEVDFYEEFLYKYFIKKTLANYVKQVSPNICQMYVNNKILQQILKDNPNIDIKKYFDNLDSNELTKELEQNILPLPK